MAGLTAEKAVEMIGSRYDLVLVASRRTRELTHGWKSQLDTKNGPVVTALREIEAGLIGIDYLFKPQNIDRKERQNQDK
jgi:DNA-directed RNA polymerase subunit omega